jgi:hypothetical protein
MADTVFETYEEYTAWYDNVHCKAAGINPKTAVTVGLVLQKSHINTKDECHYTAVISELEARGAKVVCIYSGGLDFSGPIDEYFYSTSRKVVVDSVINLTGFALVGGPASQVGHGALQRRDRHPRCCYSRCYCCLCDIVVATVVAVAGGWTRLPGTTRCNETVCRVVWSWSSTLCSH